MNLPIEFHPPSTPFTPAKYESEYERGRIAVLEPLIASGSGRRAVDVGCGPGYFTRLLASRGWATTAIDTDRSNAERAAAFAARTCVGDAVATLSQLEPRCYDLALALEIIEHMPRSHGDCLLENIARVLRPGGRLILSTPNRWSPEGLGGYYWGQHVRRWGDWKAWDRTHVHVYSSGEILQALKRHSLVVERVTGFYYRGRLPLVGDWSMPFSVSTSFPFNRLGFNITIESTKPPS